MARPRIGKGESKSIHVRFSKEQLEEIRNYSQGRDLSAIIRDAAIEHVRGVRPQVVRLLEGGVTPALRQRWASVPPDMRLAVMASLLNVSPQELVGSLFDLPVPKVFELAERVRRARKRSPKPAARLKPRGSRRVRHGAKAKRRPRPSAVRPPRRGRARGRD